MQALIYVLMCAIFLLDYLSRESGVLESYIGFVPEVVSFFILLLVVFKIVLDREIRVGAGYVLLFVSFVLVVVVGVVLNNVDPGTIFFGVRNYFKYLPLFLLPIAFPLNDERIYRLLKLVLAFAFLQLPVALFQRFIQYPMRYTGDFVSGTLNTSSILSVFLICVVSMLVAFFLINRGSVFKLIVVFSILLFPTVINETKGTFFLLPMAVLLPALAYSICHGKSSVIFVSSLMSAVLVAAFVILYNMSLGSISNRTMTDFLAEGKYINYLYREARESKLQSTEKIGRVDSILFAYDKLSDDGFRVLFGMGIGNVSASSNDKLEGEYAKYAHLAPQKTSISNLMWEVGGLGALLVLIGCLFLAKEAFCLSSAPGMAGIIGLGWFGVVIIFAVALFYKNILFHNVIGYLFAFFSGYVAACRYRLRSG